MNIIKITPLFILIASCSNVSNDIQPKFYGSYFTGLESQKISGYESAALDYDLTSPDGKNIHFSNCIQVDELKTTDVLESEYHLYQMLKLNCKALKAYAEVGASNSTYLDEILIKKDISRLPATAYPYVNDYDKSTRLNKTLSEYQKKIEIKLAPDGAIDVLTEEDSLLYQVIATGDFNGDKIEDALVRIDWHVIDAFGKGSKLTLITKLTLDGEFQELSLD